MQMVLMVLMKMKARGDEDGGHRAPAWRRGGGAPAWRRLEEGRRRRRPLGAEAPCPFFFLGDGAGVDKFLPLLGCCQGGGIS